MKKDLLKITDLTKDEIIKIIDQAFIYKKKSQIGIKKEPNFEGYVIAMIFEKPSLRTKVAFEVAAHYFGIMPIFLDSSQILAGLPTDQVGLPACQVGGQKEKGRESIPDIARNLERYADLILIRSFSHTVVQKISWTTGVPVINALCDNHHPTQALADLMAIKWKKKSWNNIKIAFIGDGNNVATSLMQICAILGVNFSIASPRDYAIPELEQERAKKILSNKAAKLNFVKDPEFAIKNADIIYTDTFISMGQESEKAVRLEKFRNYQVNYELLKKAKPDALFMHCLPAHRGEEVTDEVMDSPQSIIFDQAECRLHIAKALLHFYLSKD